MSSEMIAAYAVLTSVGIVMAIGTRGMYLKLYAKGLEVLGAVYQVLFLVMVLVAVHSLYRFLADLAGAR